MKFIRISDRDAGAVRELSALASSIVKEHFDPIIGSAQNDYMIQKYQSVSAIQEQLDHGYRYYFVCGDHGERLGFLAFYMRGTELYLSKFYLLKTQRGKGLSRQMMDFVLNEAQKAGAKSVTLNVNRNNDARYAYEKLHFRKIREEKNDIGNGFFMDDFVYEYVLDNDLTEEMLVKIARREKNVKRNYLVVNPLQGKHIPAAPGQAIGLFSRLAELVQNAYGNERLLLIGFAETATAIGAQAAVFLGADYIQTTREHVDGAEYLFFSEEHSHASEQKLVKNDLDSEMERIDRIVFMEDEITTGKTILNIVRLLRKTYPSARVQYAAASLLNGMTQEHLDRYEENGILLHYLLKTDHAGYNKRAMRYDADGTYIPCDVSAAEAVQEIRIRGALDPRRLVNAAEYEKACRKLWENLRKQWEAPEGGRVLLVGTEECMYPSLYVGRRIEELGCEVRCHSTTRSPIEVSAGETYPLHCRYELRSCYDADRITFLYDIAEYDAVVVITDAADADGADAGRNSLLHALRTKNRSLLFVRWEP